MIWVVEWSAGLGQGLDKVWEGKLTRLRRASVGGRLHQLLLLLQLVGSRPVLRLEHALGVRQELQGGIRV